MDDEQRSYPASVYIVATLCVTVVLLGLFAMAAYVVTH